MKLKYKLLLAIITVAIGICLMTYQSYALWVANFTGGDNIVTVGCFSTDFQEITSPISLNNTYPMSDQKGMSGSAYQFTITNTCSIDSRYQVLLNTLTTNEMNKNKIKYAIYKSTDGKPTTGINLKKAIWNIDTSNLNIPNLDRSYLIAYGELKEKASVTYNFYMWIDETAGNEVMNQSFEASIDVVSAATTIMPKGTEYITELAKTDTTNLAYDGTVDNNLRYIGANPNNYVTFNNELWHIIGVMNNVSDDTGNTSPKLKIIRNEYYKQMAWNSEYVNDWSTATSQIELNTTYYESINDKEKIASIKWKLGGTADYTSVSNGLASHFYGYERGTEVYSGRPTEWTGRIGLMYPSDYGYATSGGSTTNREACLAKELYRWSDASYSDCINNDWIYNLSLRKWTLTPYSGDSYNAFIIFAAGSVSTPDASDIPAVYPTLYLKPEVTIVGGSGTESAPYQLGV